MTASKKKKIGLFKLGLRIALYSSLVSGASSFLVLIIFYNLSLLSTALAACAIAFLVLLISYFFNYKLQYKRLEKLEEISRNISKKRFEEYQGCLLYTSPSPRD